jgi:7-carboxy-7-deazaguanine synthase
MVYRSRDSRVQGLCAEVVEVFASAQGEGVYLGERQTFVRFAGCNLACRYCDTDAAIPRRSYHVELSPGSDEFEVRANPASVNDLLSVVELLTPAGGVVSLTGGEPLIHAEFLLEFAPRLKERGYRIYLETNGTLHDKLESVLPYLHTVAMDIKLPSATGEADLFHAHARFLSIARATDVFVKVVVTGETLESEVLRCADIVAAVDASIPLIIQPVTPIEGRTTAPSQPCLLDLQALCSRTVRNVRIIPQCHRIVGLR